MSTTFVGYINLLLPVPTGIGPDFYANCNVPNSAHGKNVYNYCTLGSQLLCYYVVQYS